TWNNSTRGKWPRSWAFRRTPRRCACTGHASSCAIRWQDTCKGHGAQRQNIMADRRCKRIFAMLSDYLDGALPVRDCRELERHLEGCRPCIAFLESLKTTVEACRRYDQNKKLS